MPLSTTDRNISEGFTAKIQETGSFYKWELLLLLWLAFFFNQADRQIFSIVLPSLKTELSLTDAQLGLIATVLIWAYGLMVPVAGFIGDRVQKKQVIVFSLLFWSLATLFTGMCSTLVQFILLRGIATGGGEAFYAPSANSLLSTHHVKTRSRALAIHQTAVYSGIILSGLIAGYIAQQYGWRSAFYFFGFMGIILAIIIRFRLKKDEVPVTHTDRVIFSEVLRMLVKKPTVWLLTAGFACMVFVNVGYLTWMPSYLSENFGLSLSAAGFSSMFYHHIGAFIGVMLGGLLTDRLAIRKPVWRLIVQSIALLCGAPFIWWLGSANSLSVLYIALFLFGIFRGIYDANIFASLFEVVGPRIRSSAAGIMLMFAFLAGSFSPYLLGVLKPTFGLARGLSWISLSYVAGSIFIGIAAIAFFKKDQFKLNIIK